MNHWLFTWTLVGAALIGGALAGQKAERTRAEREIAAHLHDTVTVVGVQHCDDTLIGFLVVERGGAMVPHFEPGQRQDDVNKILGAAPQSGVLRVCTAREQRWN